MHWTESEVFVPLVCAVLWGVITLVSWADSGRSFLTGVSALNLLLTLALMARALGTPPRA